MAKKETLVALFTSREDARRATAALTEAGFSPDDVGCLRPWDMTQARNTLRGGAVGAGIGGLIGAIIGSGLAVVVAVTSGLGLDLYGGFLLLLAAGVAAGIAAGAGVGVLLGAEFADEEERYFAQEVEAGRTLITVWASADREMETMGLLGSCGAMEVDRLGSVGLGRRVRSLRVVNGSGSGSRAA